jgi:nucleoside-diphosphate-sugar epimerase
MADSEPGARGLSAVVFGGSGFIGRHLVTHLLSRGYEVTVADLRRRGVIPPRVRFVRCDVRRPVPLDIAATPQEVYNLAAVHRIPGHEDYEYFETNVSGAQNVTDYCRAVGVTSLCFTSSISVYGPGEDSKDEDSLARPASAYGRSKLEAERIHQLWALEDASRRLVIARPAAIFGAGEGGNFTRLAEALKRRTFIYPGRRDTIKACAYVSELVRSFEFAFSLERRLFLYNLCYPRPYTILEICEAFHSLWNLPRPVLTVPARPLLAAAWMFERLEAAGVRTGIGRARIRKLTESTHIVPHALCQEGYEFETDLAEGLKRWRQGDPVLTGANRP